jgi:hypothetical protein
MAQPLKTGSFHLLFLPFPQLGVVRAGNLQAHAGPGRKVHAEIAGMGEAF